MKKRKLFLTFIFVFFCLTFNAFAESKYVVLMDAVNIRKGPSTSYGTYTTSNIGSSYYLKSETLVADEGTGCSGGWYMIDYNGSTAYVCSEYVKVYDDTIITDDIAPTTACEVDLASKGFPSSYFIPLCKLKDTYPNWDFEPIITGLDFNVVIDQESKCGKSYISTSNTYYIDSTCTSQYPATSSWKPASSGVVTYYLDPRNFFTERYIFMFETLSYSNALTSIYPTAVTSVIKNASFYSYHASLNNDLSSIIDKVGNGLNVSPTFIASRILQEIGSSTSLYNLYSGVYPGYEGYYNFYNYGVTDACANTYGTSYCGLNYAKEQGWYGLEAAIKGGVSSISSSYINVGQNTRYLQKFNVHPTDTSKLYTHQYMTNVQAPYSEASTAYSSYKNASALSTNFTFSIPVYTNMPSSTSLPTSASDNTTNGADSGSSSSSSSTTLSAKSIITSAGYKYTDNYLTGINVGETVASLKSALESIGGNGSVTIKNASGSTITSGTISSGYQVTIAGATTSTFTVLIYGDASGDGNINAYDLLLVKRHILKAETLKDTYLKSSDIDHDGNVNAYDLLLIQRHILKTEAITQ